MPATQEQDYIVTVFCPTKNETETHMGISHSRLVEARHNGGLIIYQGVRCPIIRVEKQGELW